MGLSPTDLVILGLMKFQQASKLDLELLPPDRSMSFYGPGRLATP